MPRYSNEQVIQWFNLAQSRFARDTLMFHGKHDWPIQTGQTAYPVPGDYISAKFVSYVYPDGLQEYSITESSVADVAQRQRFSAVPERWAFWNNAIEVDSTNSSGTLRLWYYRVPRFVTSIDEINGQNEVTPRFAETVAHYATYLMLLADEEITRANQYLELYAQGVRKTIEEYVTASKETASIQDAFDPISGTFYTV